MTACESCEACAAGLKFLVDLRADLRDCIHAAPAGAASLRTLSEALRQAGPYAFKPTSYGIELYLP